MSQPSVVQAVALDLEKGLEVLSRYPVDAPEAISHWDELRRALYQTWALLPYLVLAIDSGGLYWDGGLVITTGEAPSLVGTLTDGRIGLLTIVPGAELEEISGFLTVLHQARLLTPEDEDDLSTLLWQQDFDFIHYSMAASQADFAAPPPAAAETDFALIDLDMIDFPGVDVPGEQVSVPVGQVPRPQAGVADPPAGVPDAEVGVPVGVPDAEVGVPVGVPDAEVGVPDAEVAVRTPGFDDDRVGVPSAEVVREQVRKEAAAPDAPQGVVQLEKFDSTLYFLDQPEIEYLRMAIEQDYAHDISLNVADLLFDTIQRVEDQEIRAEVIAVLEELFPYLLGTGSYAGAAHILSESRTLVQEAKDLAPHHRRAFADLAASASAPGALAQLYHTLEDADSPPSAEGLARLLSELRASAFPTMVLWLKRLTSSEARMGLRAALQTVAEGRPEALTEALTSRDEVVVRQALRFVRQVNAESAVAAVGKLKAHDVPSVRASAVKTLGALGTSAAFRALTRFLEDDDDEVRVAVLEALAQRPYAGALSRVEAMISNDVEALGLVEKRALFEAYGAMAGAGGVTILGPLLTGGGLFRSGGSSDTRACAALALGMIGTPGARAALEKGLRDRDPVVSNASRKALRGEA